MIPASFYWITALEIKILSAGILFSHCHYVSFNSLNAFIILVIYNVNIFANANISSKAWHFLFLFVAFVVVIVESWIFYIKKHCSKSGFRFVEIVLTPLDSVCGIDLSNSVQSLMSLLKFFILIFRLASLESCSRVCILSLLLTGQPVMEQMLCLNVPL